MASLFRGLRRTVPILPKDFFVCRQCLRQSPSVLRTAKVPKANLARNIRFNSTTTSFEQAVTADFGQTIQRAGAKSGERKRFWPETSSNAVGYWLLASAGSVFGIVVFGGLTRLTESGYVHL